MGNFIKALLKSKSIRSVCLPICIFLASSSINIISCVSQDLFFSEAMLHFV